MFILNSRIIKKTMMYRKKGSFTIEASLLMPCILACVLLIIFLTFYFHDICIISKYCGIATKNISLDSGNDIEATLIRDFDRNVEKALLYKWNMSRVGKIQQGKIKVTVNGEMLSGDKYLMGLFLKNLFKYGISETAYFTNGKAYIRENKR